MTNRKTADILNMLAEEVKDLAKIAHTLDLGVGELNLKAVDTGNVCALQRVDALHQHLDDVAIILRTMVDMVGPGPDLDIARLGAGVRLDYLRARLADETIATLNSPTGGNVQLF